MHIRQFIGAAAVIFSLSLAGNGALAGNGGQGDEALWDSLKEGGKVVLIRHTTAEEAEPERSMRLSPDDCSQEAQLTEEGRAQARKLGEVLKQRGVPVDEVVSSEFCRARQTMELAFGDGEVWNALNLVNAMPAADADFLMEDVRDRIGGFSGEGNLFMVSHRPNVNTITFQNVEAGSLVVLQPDGTGMFDVLGVIPVEDYQ